MRLRLLHLAACALPLAAVLTSTAPAGPKEVPSGSELRGQLFDLARPEVEDIAGQPVKFAGSMKQLIGWAFFQARIVDTGAPTELLFPE